MPPLGPETYRGIHRNEARIALVEREKRLRRSTYNRMSAIVKQPRLKVANYPFSFHVHYETPKAVYQVERQDKTEFTRAWLYFGPNDDTGLSTDRIRVTADKGIEVVDNSELHHFSLSPLMDPDDMKKIAAIEFSGRYYKFDVEQDIDFWGQVGETLDLIQAATDATGNQRVAAYPAEPWPTLAILAAVS